MINQELKLIEIEELLSNYHFFIPSYQRGYKWDTRQVLDLLNDIYEFANKQKLKDEFYCLQPIVVSKEKSDNEKKYKVIDGQQRLTTIYLILKYLQNLKKEFEEIKKECKKIEYFCNFENYEIKEVYHIKYATRNDSENFLKGIHQNYKNENEKYKNPDYFYLSNAYEVIMNWFKDKNKQLFLNTLLHKTKIIWYEVETKNENEEIQIFTRLNIGKIPLTNAELIKAMLLLETKDYKEQIEFSNIWDKMELTLQNDEFWYFLSNKTKEITAIDLVFEVLALYYKDIYNEKKSNEEDKINFNQFDDKFSFYVFDKLLKENEKSRNEIWEDAQKIYRFFVDWYNDKEIYHKVGYIINFNKLNLTELIKEYEKKTKNNFKKFLNETIEKMLKGTILNKLNYNDKNVRKVLLLFNIETILQNSNSNYRFKFDKYKNKNENWDIEHIASQTDNTSKIEWVKTIYKYLKGKELKFNNEKREAKIIGSKYDCIYKIVKIKLNIKELPEELKDNIGNLVLLNSKINRSYKNAFFPIKRAVIIEEDSKGNFIPPATKNVFLKQYSNKLSDMMNWNEDDIKSYREKIYELLKKYGVKLGDENETKAGE
jgi:uncharacterized protein with ParB-like and HNH nuclease domain